MLTNRFYPEHLYLSKCLFGRFSSADVFIAEDRFSRDILEIAECNEDPVETMFSDIHEFAVQAKDLM